MWQKLMFEKEVTGVYISGHPMEEFAEYIEPLRYTTLDFAFGEGEEDDESKALIDGRFMTLAGILSDVRTKATRANTLMAYATLEDMHSTVDLVVFPKTYEKVSQVLKDETAVLVYGRANIEDDKAPSFVVSEVVPLNVGSEESKRLMDADAREAAASSHRRAMVSAYVKDKKNAPAAPSAEIPLPDYSGIDRPAPRTRGEDLPSFDPSSPRPAPQYKLWLRLKSFDNEFLMMGINSILSDSPGSDPVFALALDTGRKLRLHSGFAYNEGVISRLKEILGEENVVAVKGKKDE